MSYDMIDRFLRNNLDDDDYAEYSLALDQVAYPPPQRTWVGLTAKEVADIVVYPMNQTADVVKAIEAKLKEKNT